MAASAAHKQLFVTTRFSREKVQAALIKGIYEAYEAKDILVIEACMEALRMQSQCLSRADVARAMLDVLKEVPEPDLNEFIWYNAQRYFTLWSRPLPADQMPGFIEQCETLITIHPAQKAVLEKIRDHVLTVSKRA